MRAPRFLSAMAALLMLSTPALAWNNVGHMLIARLAWDQLNPEQRQAVSQILRAHPQYDILLIGKPDNFDADLYVFMRAACWPDMVRSGDSAMHDEHRPFWHFINFPITRDGTKGAAPDTEWDGKSDPV